MPVRFEFATLPFANVGQLMQRIPLPVPAILGHSDALGIVALQDLGDVTLQAHLGAATPAQHAALYRAGGGVDRDRCSGAAPSSRRASYLPYGIAFDVEKLTWELRFLHQAFRRGLSRRRRSPRGDARRSTEEWSAIASELAAEPRVLCHRDYHSRNLMLRDGQPVHHRLPGRADGPGHLRPGVAAARFATSTSAIASSTSSIAYFLALEGRGPPATRARRSSAAGST